MKINKNKEISMYYSIWLNLQKKGISFREYNNFFKESSFAKTIDKLLAKHFNQLNFFNDELKEILRIASDFEKKWNDLELKSFTKDDFNSFPCLKEVMGALFFFYKGNLNILNDTSENFVSVVGSRKTPNSWKNWIIENVPKNKIIVSGLAYGADILAHQVAIKNNQKIVVFPGIDITTIRNEKNTNEIINYCTNNGIILSNVIPLSKTYLDVYFLLRNKWMAQISKDTYVVYFNGQSGTLGQLLEAAKRNKNIYMDKSIYELNKEFLSNHSNFSQILPKIIEV